MDERLHQPTALLVYTKLGELTEAVKGLSNRFDEHDQRQRDMGKRVDDLEASRDKTTATLRTLKWIASVAVGVISLVGIEKLPALLHSLTGIV